MLITITIILILKYPWLSNCGLKSESTESSESTKSVVYVAFAESASVFADSVF